MQLVLSRSDGLYLPVDFEFDDLILAGWSGRDESKVLKHIKELKELGIPPPTSVPSFFRVGAHLLTTRRNFRSFGDRNNGEVEYVLFVREGRPLYVTVGSDHTSRDLERRSIPLSKRVYPKVIPPVVWSYMDVRDHWDELLLRMYVDGELAQESKLSTILAPEDLLSRLEPGNFVLFSGSITWIDGLKFGSEYRMEIVDPILVRKIAYSYSLTPGSQP